MGSSPHTRGALNNRLTELEKRGIIPAYAGSTQTALCTGHRPGDHPRIRGEHPGCSQRNLRPRGSSPHTRGAPSETAPSRKVSGIIPAYAGSTNLPLMDGIDIGDHPRIRGEHSGVNLSSSSKKGSSPHTRGARTKEFSKWHKNGIIPAYAGSTSPATRYGAGWWDHPRIRGEHGITASGDETVTGSSPHTRGARSFVAMSISIRGIIPAYAGSTTPPKQSVICTWDHPRIRGEHYPT